MLLIVYIHYLEDADVTLKKVIYIIIKGTIIWGVGYALTWITKWLIASVILKKNVISDALEQVAYRSYGGNEQSVFLEIFIAVRKNIGSLLMDRIGIFLAVVLVCSLLVFFIRLCQQKKGGIILLPIVLVSIYPYIWYIVLAQHSIQHSYFTYKAQLITIWAILLLGAEGIHQVGKEKIE